MAKVVKDYLGIRYLIRFWFRGKNAEYIKYARIVSAHDLEKVYEMLCRRPDYAPYEPEVCKYLVDQNKGLALVPVPNLPSSIKL